VVAPADINPGVADTDFNIRCKIAFSKQILGAGAKFFEIYAVNS
jgi:hypothetical protein